MKNIAVIAGNHKEYREFIRSYRCADYKYFYVDRVEELYGWERKLEYVLYGTYRERTDFRDICDRLRILAGRDLTSATMLYIKL